MRFRFLFVISIVWLSFANAEDVTFESNASVKRNNETTYRDVKAGEKLHVNRGEFIYVVTPNSPPMLLFSASNDRSQIDIKDANFSNALYEILQPQLEKSSNEILSGLRRADQLIQKRNYAQASQVIVPLREKYPKVSSVLFMDATVHFLMNDKEAAANSLEKGLAIEPTNQEAKKLLSRLRGGQ